MVLLFQNSFCVSQILLPYELRARFKQQARSYPVSDAEAADMSGMLRAKSAFDAEQEETRKAAYTAQMADKLADLFQTPSTMGQEAADGQGTEPAPVAAYRFISDSGLPPHVRDTALARIMDGTFGKQDDLEIKAALVSGLAFGALTENAIDKASLSGGLTAATVSGIREFNKTLQGEDGLLFRGGCEILENSLPPGAQPEQRARAQDFLLHQLTRAAKAGRLAEAIDLKNPGNAVTLSASLAGMGQGGEPDTLKVLTVDHAPLDDSGGYQVAAGDFTAGPRLRTQKRNEGVGIADVKKEAEHWEQKRGGPVHETSGRSQKHTDQGKKLEEQYYVLGMRPLKVKGIFMGPLYNISPAEHRQFIRSDGHNIGLFSDGTHGDSEENLARYEYTDGIKYKAKYVDKAMAEIDKEWPAEQKKLQLEMNQEIERAQKDFSAQHGVAFGEKSLDPSTLPIDRYRVAANNCQHYARAVLRRAKELAGKDGEPLIIDKGK